MPVVPKIIHFVRALDRFDVLELHHIIEWAVRNPAYDTRVWVFDNLQEQITHEIVEQLYNSPLYGNPLLRDVLPAKLIQFSHEHEEFVITVWPLGVVPPLEDKAPRLVRNLIDSYEKKHASRDLASLWVLHRYGGIFVEADMPCPQQQLPINIAPRSGILFAKYHRSLPSLVNHFIASPPNTEQLRTLHQKFMESYEGHFTESFRPTQIDTILRYQVREMKRAVQKAEDNLLDYSFDPGLAYELEVNQRQLQKYMEEAKMGTKHNTTVIRDWLEEELERANATILRNAVPYSRFIETEHEDFTDFTVVDFNPQPPPDPSLPPPPVPDELDVMDYSFQDQEQFALNVPPSALGLSATGAQPDLYPPTEQRQPAARTKFIKPFNWHPSRWFSKK
ncbi:MAG: hypothetical protein MI749_04250 [Desulfovibrionales bacterium]|nr:hypothetical protein [Desulfovibrionales bacterium]